jgi:hypothetical protein
MQSQKIAIITTIALLIVISAFSTLTPQSASAYEKSQATSQTSACGNEFMPINIGCQNTDSQIQGDENAVALTAQQTFPEVKFIQEKPSHPPKTPPPEPEPEPQTCEECFTRFLTETQIQEFLLHAPGGPGDLEFACNLIGARGGISLEQLDDSLGSAGIPEEIIQQVIECVERVLGIEPPEQ